MPKWKNRLRLTRRLIRCSFYINHSLQILATFRFYPIWSIQPQENTLATNGRDFRAGLCVSRVFMCVLGREIIILIMIDRFVIWNFCCECHWVAIDVAIWPMPRGGRCSTYYCWSWSDLVKPTLRFRFFKRSPCFQRIKLLRTYSISAHLSFCLF